MPRGARRTVPKTPAPKITVTDGRNDYWDGKTHTSMTQQPRSFVDKLLGRSTVSFSRSGPTINLTKQKSNKFKPRPTSNGKGIGP